MILSVDIVGVQSDLLLTPTEIKYFGLLEAAEQKWQLKAMKTGAWAMSKGSVTKAIATECELKRKECAGVMDSLVAIGIKELKKTGIFIIPGLCRIKTRVKPATKAGVRMMFGKETKMKAKPAKTVVKVYTMAALKMQI